MLRITIQEGSGYATIKLEGDLSGPWVKELERCWKSALATAEKRDLRVELDTVTYVDASGKTLLREMHAAGARLMGRGALTSYIVEQIQRRRVG